MMTLKRFTREAALLLTLALLVFVPAVTTPAQQPQRPRITGISHVAYFVSDLPAALRFWHDLLGYDVYFTLNKKDSSEIRIAFIKINDHQHVELFTEPPTAPPNRMSHLCFTVDDIEKMRTYLRSQGFDIEPGDGSTTKAGDYAFEIKDPDGMLLEFVQPLPSGVEMKDAGKFMPASRISDKIYHAGFLVGNSRRSLDFYEKLLGFQETWRGGADPKQLSWINLRVPDGTDYVEFMLYSTLPPRRPVGRPEPSLALGSGHRQVHRGS